jgi:hypothetical protein
MKKMKRYEEGGDVDSDIEYTTDEEGNEVAISRKGYSSRPAAPTVAKATPAVKKAQPSAPKSKASVEYATAARNKYAEARGYDEASKNKNLSAEDRRAMLGRYAQAMRDYDTLGRASLSMNAKGMKRGGSVSSASKRADGIAQRGKTKGRVL